MQKHPSCKADATFKNMDENSCESKVVAEKWPDSLAVFAWI